MSRRDNSYGCKSGRFPGDEDGGDSGGSDCGGGGVGGGGGEVR